MFCMKIVSYLKILKDTFHQLFKIKYENMFIE